MTEQNNPLALDAWFQACFDNAAIRLNVQPPNRPAWQAEIKWARIIRVCFKTGDLLTSDEIYIFTDERPESYLLPIEANGGGDVWNEIRHYRE